MFGKLFGVATEFRFEIGSALLNSQALQNSVQQLSGAADNALLSFQRLSMGVISGMGNGPLGIAGALASGIKAADKFAQSQIAMASIIAANREHLVGPIETFNDQLRVSDTIMADISKKAREFSLPTGPMVEMTKGLAAMLVPKGLAGDNFSTAIDMSRGLLKSSGVLGVDPYEVQGQLIRAVEGGASLGDTLFRRLASETSAFKELGGGNNITKTFNALPAAKRVDILQRSLTQFANVAQATDARVNSLSGQFQMLRNLIDPNEFVSNIFRPLGQALIPPIVSILKEANKYLDNEARRTLEILAKTLGPVIESPKDVLVNLLTIRRLSDDLKVSANAAGLLGIVTGFGALAGLLTKLPVVGPVLAAFYASVQGFVVGLFNPMNLLRGLFAGAAWLGRGLVAVVPMLLRLAPMIFGVLSKIFAPVLFIFSGMQVISRAMSMAKVNDAIAYAKALPVVTELVARMGKALYQIVRPFLFVVDGLATMIEPLFRASIWLRLFAFLGEGLAIVLEGLGKLVNYLLAGFRGLALVIFELLESLVTMNFSGLGDRLQYAFTWGFESAMDELGRQTSGDDPAVVKNVTQIGSVTIQNQFKEQLEPDRIAFLLVDQLQKTAANPTQARGRAFSRSSVGGS